MAELAGLLCASFGLLFGLLLVVAARRRRRERDRRRRWAESNGWALTEQPDVDWGRHLPGGNKRGIEYAFSAVRRGRRVWVAQYSVTDPGDGTTPQTHHHIVVVATLDRPLPATEVAPRGRVSRMLGRGEGATGVPGFDRQFRIRTDEPAALGHLIGPALIDAQLGHRVPPAWSVHGTTLLHHRPGRLELDQVPRWADGLVLLAALIDHRAG
ncbi:hypothetical protein Ade02nite_72470 [Paractinoplanes deccanensis]|uniref:Secreted protein n=1 Tax=Paractinoplanes deccanensis TaxID=113561 RepID=A0ABQ3YF14_9ACTN|nr:hypothetical protein [Actinoplanes deccanensis]GID78606.1 hypothetical protein Ade02nite_72470 [Actinoplanes deccanensis]